MISGIEYRLYACVVLAKHQSAHQTSNETLSFASNRIPLPRQTSDFAMASDVAMMVGFGTSALLKQMREEPDEIEL